MVGQIIFLFLFSPSLFLSVCPSQWRAVSITVNGRQTLARNTSWPQKVRRRVTRNKNAVNFHFLPRTSHCVIVLCRRDFPQLRVHFAKSRWEGINFDERPKIRLNYHILRQEAATDAKVFFELLFINGIRAEYLTFCHTDRPRELKG